LAFTFVAIWRRAFVHKIRADQAQRGMACQASGRAGSPGNAQREPDA
jgi:hypothetical protein